MENKQVTFEELRKLDVSKQIEKKNGLSYLSWAYAVDTLLQKDPTATWEYKEEKKYGETLMVFCEVHAFGRSRTAQLPVMDYRNQAIPNPNSFQVNTAMQRCLAKAIALHGIGLYIYAGEDIPQGENDQPVKSQAPSDENQDDWVNSGEEIPKEYWRGSPESKKNFLAGGKPWKDTAANKWFILRKKQDLTKGDGQE